MRACQCLCLLVESLQAEGMSVCLSVGLFDWLHVCTFVCRSVCRPFKATSRGMDEGGFHGGGSFISRVYFSLFGRSSAGQAFISSQLVAYSTM